MPAMRRTAPEGVSSPAIQFKGNGFYITDYARKPSKDTEGKTPEKPKAKKTGESKPDAKAVETIPTDKPCSD